MVRLPDGRLHLISAIAPQKSVSTSSTTTGSQTLPASTVRPTSAPRTLLIGGQRFLLSSTPGGPTSLLSQGSVGSQKIISGLSGSGLSRPQLMLTSPSQSTVIRMPSGQHVMLRPSQPATAVSASQSSTTAGSTTAQGLLTGKSPPSSPYAVTPEVVQHGNYWQSLLVVFLLAELFTYSAPVRYHCLLRFVAAICVDNWNCSSAAEVISLFMLTTETVPVLQKSYHIISSRFAMALPILSSEAQYKVKYRLNNTTK